MRILRVKAGRMKIRVDGSDDIFGGTLLTASAYMAVFLSASWKRECYEPALPHHIPGTTLAVRNNCFSLVAPAYSSLVQL